MNFSKEMEQTRLNPGAELSLLPLALKAGSFRSSSASDAGPECSSFLMWIVDVRGILASTAELTIPVPLSRAHRESALHAKLIAREISCIVSCKSDSAACPEEDS